MSDVIDNSKVSSIEKYDNRIRVSNYDLTRFGNDPEFRDCNLTGSELRVKSLLIVNSHKGIDIVNGIL